MLVLQQWAVQATRIINTTRRMRGRRVTSPCAPIAHFVQLCVSKEEEVKESFKGKDMTYEQYQQLKQLNDSHGQGPKEDETDTKDSADAAQRRSVCLLDSLAYSPTLPSNLRLDWRLASRRGASFYCCCLVNSQKG